MEYIGFSWICVMIGPENRTMMLSGVHKIGDKYIQIRTAELECEDPPGEIGEEGWIVLAAGRSSRGCKRQRPAAAG
jgi:hypothetical protein